MKKYSILKYFFIVLAILLVIFSILIYNSLSIKDIGLGDIENISDLEGNKVEIVNFIDQDRPIIVNYWATWCVPCIEEFRYFQEVKNEYGNKVNFIMISDEPPEKVINFLKNNNYDFIFLVSKIDFSFIGVNARPITFFYNSKGILIEKHIGGLTNQKIKEYIEKIF